MSIYIYTGVFVCVSTHTHTHSHTPITKILTNTNNTHKFIRLSYTHITHVYMQTH